MAILQDSAHVSCFPGLLDIALFWSLLLVASSRFPLLTHHIIWHVCVSLFSLLDCKLFGKKAKIGSQEKFAQLDQINPLLFPDAITYLCQEFLCPGSTRSRWGSM